MKWILFGVSCCQIAHLHTNHSHQGPLPTTAETRMQEKYKQLLRHVRHRDISAARQTCADIITWPRFPLCTAEPEQVELEFESTVAARSLCIQGRVTGLHEALDGYAHPTAAWVQRSVVHRVLGRGCDRRSAGEELKESNGRGVVFCTARTARQCRIVPVLIRTRLLSATPRIEIDILPATVWVAACRVARKILHSEFGRDAAHEASVARASDLHDLARGHPAEAEFFGVVEVLLEKAPRCDSVHAVGDEVPALMTHCFAPGGVLRMGGQVPFQDCRCA